MDYLVKLTDEGKRYEATPDDSPVPVDLIGVIHEHTGQPMFQSNHMMCKLAMLRDETASLTYEFLVEYDIFETDVEIYYGVKAVSDDLITTEEFKAHVLEDWEKVRRAKKYRKLAGKFKITNNGNYGTFWPFWIRLNINCKESLYDTVSILKVFYDDYAKVLKLKPFGTERFSLIYDNLMRWDETSDDYSKLLIKINDQFSAGSSRAFEKVFVEGCLKGGIIERINDTRYKVSPSVPTYKFVYLVRNFFYELYALMPSQYKKDRTKGLTPLKELTKVFLGKKKKPISDSDWKKSCNDLGEVWDECEASVKSWLVTEEWLNFKSKRQGSGK